MILDTFSLHRSIQTPDVIFHLTLQHLHPGFMRYVNDLVSEAVIGLLELPWYDMFRCHFQVPFPYIRATQRCIVGDADPERPFSYVFLERLPWSNILCE
jgi:hypothetical protein